MTIENGVRIVAGTMILISVALTRYVHPLFWIFTAFIGLSLIQSVFTGFCPPAILLRKLLVRQEPHGRQGGHGLPGLVLLLPQAGQGKSPLHRPQEKVARRKEAKHDS